MISGAWQRKVFLKTEEQLDLNGPLQGFQNQYNSQRNLVEHL
jgi:hypothetical protein